MISSKYFLINHFNYEICRTCLQIKQVLFCLYDEDIISKLKMCTSVHFDENDGLPNKICITCMEKLAEAYNFANICQESDTKLRKNLRIDSGLDGTFTIAELLKRNNLKKDNSLLNSEKYCLNTAEQLTNIINDKVSTNRIKQTNYIRSEMETPITNINQNCFLALADNYQNLNSVIDPLSSENLLNHELTKTTLKTKNTTNMTQSENYKVPNTNQCKNIINLDENKVFTDKSFEITKPVYVICKMRDQKLINIELLRRSDATNNSVERDHEGIKFTHKDENISPTKSLNDNFIDDQVEDFASTEDYCNEKDNINYKSEYNEKVSFDSIGDDYSSNEITVKKENSMIEDDYVNINNMNNEFEIFEMKVEELASNETCPKYDDNKSISEIHNCDSCNLKFKQLSDLISHMKIHIDCHAHKGEYNTNEIKKIQVGNDLYICKICSKSFMLKENLRRHVRQHFPETLYKCHICLEAFTQDIHLSTHLRLHNDERPYKCEICLKIFKQKCHLIRHLRLHNNEQPYKCELCSKKFKQKSNLRTHLTLHFDELPYKCEICSNTFKRKSHLIQHLLVHNDDRPYKCEVCLKTFARIHNLKLHKRLHTGEHRYKCQKCSKTFSQKCNLTTHIKMHNGYKCEVCSKIFVNLGSLTKHKIQQHANERPYKCPVCLETFTHSYYLTIHSRFHNDQRPYTCEMCSKTFVLFSNFTKHKRTHERVTTM